MIIFISASPLKIDLGIVIGSSDINKMMYFQTQLEFLRELASTLPISRDNILPTIMTYGQKINIRNKLGSIAKRNSMINALRFKDKPLAGFKIDEIESWVRNDLFHVRNGGRKDAAKVLLLFTTQEINKKDFGIKLQKHGIKLVIIGLGNEVDRSNMLPLVSHEKFAFVAEDKESLGSKLNDISKALQVPGNNFVFRNTFS